MAYLIEGPVIVHACPPGDAALTPCCGRNPHDLPRGHRITLDPSLVTCELTPAQRVAYRNRAAVDVAASLAPGPIHQAPIETVTDPDGAYSRGFRDGSRGAKGLGDRLDHLAALVTHYERHLTATGRGRVITEAHRRANTTPTTHPDSEETAP